MTVFIEALVGGLLLALLLVLAWRLAQRIGRLLPRRRQRHGRLLCVRPLDPPDA